VKLKSSLHRSAIVLAGAVVGLVGVVAIAGPASAHTASVSATTKCVNGSNVVTWTLTNDWVDTSGAKVENLKLAPGQAPVRVDPKPGDKDITLHEGTILSTATRQGASSVQYTQTVDQAASAAISFDAHWTDDDHYQDNLGTSINLIQDCKQPAPKCVDANHAQYSHTFDVNKVGATTVISLKDDVKLCRDVKVPVTSVSYYAPKPQFDVPQYEFDKDSGYLTDDARTLKLWVATPPCYTQVDTFFGTEKNIIPTITANGPRYGNSKLGSPRTRGYLYSQGPQAWYNGGDTSCVTPASTSVPSCDGTQAINLSNSGKYDETFTVKYGDQVKTVTVGAGQGAPVKVPAGAGTVTVSAEGMKDQTYTWTTPQDCALPTVDLVNTCTDVTVTVTNPVGVSPAKATISYGAKTKELTVAAGSSEKATFAAGSATYATIQVSGIDKQIKAALKKLVCATPTTAGGGGGLPVTGAAGGTIAGGAAVLLLAGGVLFFVARRRKVRFTA
jgi:LPXTG-motif cell wall-anchored protein